MGIREKLQDLKRRLSDRKMYSIIVVVIAAVAIFGIYQYKNSISLRQQLDNQYNRAFYDMTGYVNNVQVLLVKSLISGSPAKTASTLQEAWKQATLAQTNLGQLPVSQQILANTSKFLTQVGDLAYTLNNQNIQGKPLSDQQYKTIERLDALSVSLGKSLNNLQSQLNQGRLKWGDLAKKGTPLFKKSSSSLTIQNFENVDKTFQDYPTLIYDGPFSDHLAKSTPKGVTGEQLTVAQAKEKVASFFSGEKIDSIVDNGKNDSGPINTYSYKVTFKNAPKEQTAMIDVTQKGGHIYWMLYNRPSTGAKINVDQAKELGRKYLEAHGYANMVDTYYLKEDSTATINYAYKQDKVTIYPDLIKVKIALDNGEIIGIESKSYLTAHTVRTLPAPKITEKQARALINPRVKVLSSDLAVIPTDFKTELFTYEFKGKLNDRDFLVYINTETGKEENILMIINTPKGILTM
jgi:spore germination protein